MPQLVVNILGGVY